MYEHYKYDGKPQDCNGNYIECKKFNGYTDFNRYQDLLMEDGKSLYHIPSHISSIETFKGFAKRDEYIFQEEMKYHAAFLEPNIANDRINANNHNHPNQN